MKTIIIKRNDYSGIDVCFVEKGIELKIATITRHEFDDDYSYDFYKKFLGQWIKKEEE